MKRMIAKFPGTCCDCHKPINVQTPIKYFGRGRASHANCFNPEGKTERELAAEQRAPCWICKHPEGKFRQIGAGTPVWCDACYDKHREQQKDSLWIVRNISEQKAGAQ